MMFWCKVFTVKHDVLVAICDEELLGKKIKSKGLTITISKNFYGGEKIDEETAKKFMEIATIGNLFGKKIVELAKKQGLVAEENVISINGIEHAQFVKMINI
jgi:hypothetical protein